MKKEEIVNALAEAGVDVSLTGQGEIRGQLLELALDGVTAKKVNDEAASAAQSHEKVIKTLNKRIEELEAQKTPEPKGNLVRHKKSKKTYRLKHPTNFRGKKIDAAFLNENQDVLSDLIETKSTILVEEKEG